LSSSKRSNVHLAIKNSSNMDFIGLKASPQLNFI